MTDALPPYPADDRPPRDPGRRERPASLARRVVPAVAILGAAGGLLALLDHPDDGLAAADDGADTALTPGTTAAPTPTTTPGSGSTSRSTTTTVPATPTCTGTTVTGDAASTKFGPVQVQITLDASGAVCAVEAIDWPDDDRKSQSINARAVPQLDQRAASAGSTSFNGISGATVTSNAYKKSLQSALDQA